MSPTALEDPSKKGSQSYMPKWLLESRAQLEESRLRKLEVDRLLSALQGHVQHLGHVLSHDGEGKESRSGEPSPTAPESESGVDVSSPVPLPESGLRGLPRHVLSMALFRYLSMCEVLRLSCTSRAVHGLLLNDECWVVAFDALPRRLKAQAEAEDSKQEEGWRRRAILAHHSTIQDVQAMLRRLPGQTSDSATSRHRDFVQYGGQRAKDTGLTLIAALRHLACLTSDPSDGASCLAFRRAESVRVLLPLLKNESDTVGELVACVIANLLCPLTTGSEKRTQQELRLEVESLRGRALLVSRLVSPTARLTLSKPGHNATSSSRAAMMALGSQRLSARHAARALVNLFAPTLATCTDVGQQQASPFEAKEEQKAECTALAGRWTAAYFFSSGNEQEVHTLELCSVQGGKEGEGFRLEGRGSDFLGAFSIDGSVHQCWNETACCFYKTYLDRGGARPLRGHVSHVAWAEADGQNGLWGVWEMVTTSTDAHYDLQKGGVFRLVPLTE